MTIEYGTNSFHPSDNAARDEIIREREERERREREKQAEFKRFNDWVKTQNSGVSIYEAYLHGKDQNAATEELVRFCPECGKIGEVDAKYQDCCPEGSSSRVVPKSFAEICRKTFKDLVNRPNLKVWLGEMPESNGKTNHTAILYRDNEISSGITIDRSEYPDRVRYEADRMRWMLGMIDEEPFILDYDADKHSGYVPPAPKPPYDAVNRVDAFVRRYRMRRGLDQSSIHALDGELELRPDDLRALIRAALHIPEKAMDGVDKSFEQWKQSPFFYEWTTNDQHAELNFRAGWHAAKTDGNAIEDERAAFEEAIKDRGEYNLVRSHIGDGYVSGTTNCMWIGWKMRGSNK